MVVGARARAHGGHLPDPLGLCGVLRKTVCLGLLWEVCLLLPGLLRAQAWGPRSVGTCHPPLKTLPVCPGDPEGPWVGQRVRPGESQATETRPWEQQVLRTPWGLGVGRCQRVRRRPGGPCGTLFLLHVTKARQVYLISVILHGVVTLGKDGFAHTEPGPRRAGLQLRLLPAPSVLLRRVCGRVSAPDSALHHAGGGGVGLWR